MVPVHPFAQYVRPNPSRTLVPVTLPASVITRARRAQRHDAEDDATQDDFFANNVPCTD